MRIETEEGEYWVIWNYQQFPKTICKIYDDAVQGKPNLIGEGFATKYAKDSNNKIIAREESLVRALYNTPVGTNEPAIYNKYMEIRRKPKPPRVKKVYTPLNLL